MRPRLVLPAILLGLLVATSAAAGLDELPLGSVVIGGTAYPAHIADDSRERGQGFQHVPAERIREAMIYFAFPRPLVPRFHMRNVAAPLAIAWIDAEGRVIAIDVMRPGMSGYAPPGPISAALELHPDRVEDVGLAVGVRVSPE